MKILVAGDFAPVARLSEIFSKSVDESVLKGVSKYIKEADYSIVNLEAPVKVDDKFKIKKSGPNLSSNENAILALQSAGFNACSIANNHLRDYGSEGVLATIDTLKQNGLDYVGGGSCLEDSKRPLVVNIAGKTLSIIAVCETEYSIASDTQAGSAPIDIVDISKQILDARKKNDYVLVITHGGHEYYHYPSPRMKKLYRYFIELGADAIVNHHQHCISGYEVYNDKAIIYGVGNFCFDRVDKRNDSWNDGYMVVLDLADEISFEVIPYVQCNDKACVHVAEDISKSRILEKISEINEVIGDDMLLNNKYKEFIKVKKKKNIMAVFSPYLNDKMRIAAGHHLIPYLLPKNKVRAILNMIQCEAHYDETIEVLTNYINGK